MRLVFADSEVAGIEAQGDTLRIRFAAAAVEPTAAGEEAGYLLGLVLTLRGARWQGDPAACFGRLRGGTIVDAVSRLAAIELPFDGPGPWHCEWAFAQGQQLVADAAHASALPQPGTRFVPTFAC